MILHVYNLSHVFHLVADSLITIASHIDTIVASRPEIGDARRVKVLVLWGRAVAFELIELELVLVRRTADASLVDMMRTNRSMCLLFDELSIQ